MPQLCLFFEARRRNLATRLSLRALGVWYLDCELGTLAGDCDCQLWWTHCHIGVFFFRSGRQFLFVCYFHGFALGVSRSFIEHHLLWTHGVSRKKMGISPYGDPGAADGPQVDGWFLCLDGVYNTIRWHLTRLRVKCDLRAYQCRGMDIRVPKPLGSDTGGFSNNGAQKSWKHGTSRFISVSFFLSSLDLCVFER